MSLKDEWIKKNIIYRYMKIKDEMFPQCGYKQCTHMHTHTRKLFSLKKKKSNPAICNTRDESEGHFIVLHPS